MKGLKLLSVVAFEALSLLFIDLYNYGIGRTESRRQVPWLSTRTNLRNKERFEVRPKERTKL